MRTPGARPSTVKRSALRSALHTIGSALVVALRLAALLCIILGWLLTFSGMVLRILSTVVRGGNGNRS